MSERVRRIPEKGRTPCGQQGGTVSEERIVPGEQLVSTIACQSDLHLRARQPGEAHHGEDARVSEGFVERGRRVGK